MEWSPLEAAMRTLLALAATAAVVVAALAVEELMEALASLDLARAGLIAGILSLALGAASRAQRAG